MNQEEKFLNHVCLFTWYWSTNSSTTTYHLLFSLIDQFINVFRHQHHIIDDSKRQQLSGMGEGFAQSVWRKLKCLDGSLKKLVDDSNDIEDWWSVNSMLVGWMLQFIGSTLRSSIMYNDTVMDLWDPFHQHFSVGNAPRVHQLRTKTARYELNGHSIDAYFACLQHLWNELNTCVPPSTCECGGCNFTLKAKLQKHWEENWFINSSWGSIPLAIFGTMCSTMFAKDELAGIDMV